jgi:hypothetical protein
VGKHKPKDRSDEKRRPLAEINLAEGGRSSGASGRGRLGCIHLFGVLALIPCLVSIWAVLQ